MLQQYAPSPHLPLPRPPCSILTRSHAQVLLSCHLLKQRVCVDQQIYKKSQSKKNSIHKAVTQAAKSFDLYPDNPRMIPRHLTPTVLKMEMTVGKFIGHRYVQLVKNYAVQITSFFYCCQATSHDARSNHGVITCIRSVLLIAV